MIYLTVLMAENGRIRRASITVITSAALLPQYLLAISNVKSYPYLAV